MSSKYTNTRLYGTVRRVTVRVEAHDKMFSTVSGGRSYRFLNEEILDRL